MRQLEWKRVVRSMALAAAAAAAIWGTLYLIGPVMADAACGEGQVSAVYYNWNADDGSWQQVASRCETGPSGGSFSRDFSSDLPDGVESSQFRVEMTGTLAGTAGSWYQFSASGDTALLAVQVDGLAATGGAPYLALNASNAFALVYEKSDTPSFTLAWTEAATACTAEEMLAIYALSADDAREARVIQCESGPTGNTLERKAADLPTLDGDYRATYTGQLDLSESGWYQFEASPKSGDTLSAAVGGETVVSGSDPSGYLELDAAGALVVSYAHTGADKGSFTLSWSRFACDTGLFLAAYYDGASGNGRASTLRCEPMPSGASLAGGKSAKWTGTRYVEGGSYAFAGPADLTYSLDGGPETAVGGSAETIAEGLHEVAFRYKKETGPVTATVTNQGTGITLPPCPEGQFARTGTGLAPTCEATPVAGDGLAYTGRLWFQGGEYQVAQANLANLTIDGTAVTGSPTLAEGTHDLSFTATSDSGAPSLTFTLIAGCPEGTFRSAYRQGSASGSIAFGACEPRPDYNWSTALPPTISGAFSAQWTGEVPLAETGLHQFAATGDQEPTFILQVPDDEGNLEGVSLLSDGSVDLTPHLYTMGLTYASADGASPSAGLDWTSPSSDTAPLCPDGLFRAEYFTTSLTDSPYLVTCEEAPYLTYQRSWMAGAPYAVRWTGRMLLDPGEHDLTLTAGGNASLYVDGALAATAASTEGLSVQSFTWDMARGYHEVMLEYTGGGEFDFVRLQRAYQSPADDPATGCPAGWFQVQWWDNNSLTGPAAAATCESGPPNYLWSFEPPAAITNGDWSARWTGTVSFPAGRYRFHILARNAVRVLVGPSSTSPADLEPVVEEFTFTQPGGSTYPYRPLFTNGMHVTDAEVNLTGGDTKVVIEYATSAAQAPGVDPVAVPGTGLKVWWEAAGAPALIGAGFTATDTLELRYDSALDAEASPGAASFLLSEISGTEVATGVPAIAGQTVTLILQSKSMADEEQVIVRYDPNRAGALRGEAAPLVPLTDLAGGKSLSDGTDRQLDLGDVYRIDEWKLFGDSACCDALTVSLSLDGSSWTTVHAHTGPGSIHTDSRPYLRLQPSAPVARYIRLSGAGAASITTVQAWGSSSGNPAAVPAPLTGTGPVNVALGQSTAVTGTATAEHGPELGVNDSITKRMVNGQDVPDYFEVKAHNPAWQVDLGDLYLVSSIRVYNRSDCCYAEADGFILETSTDGATWTAVSHSDEPFGGLDNAPYIRSDLAERPARYVRVRLEGDDKTLHLAEVQVYGVPAIASLIVPYHASGPVLSRGIDVIDDVVTLRYDKVIDSASVPPPTSFSVRVDGATYTPEAVQVYGPNVVLYLPVRTDPTMHVAVSYSQGTGVPVLQDLTGKAAAEIGLEDALYLAVVPENYALNKPVSYSGTVDGANAADKGVNGVRYYTGEAGSAAYDYFSIAATGSAPYWQVDLRDLYAIEKIRLFNRYDGGWDSAQTLRIQLSVDGATWRTIYVNDQQRSPATFGNPPGEPLVVDLTYENARYVRLTLDGPGTLSLAEVQVYGLPGIQAWNVALDRPATATSAVGTYTQWTDIHLGAQPPAGMAESEFYNPALATDGDSTTALRLQRGSTDTSWQADLRQAYTLSRINILTDGPANLGSYTIAYMQPGDTDWQTLDLTGRVLTDENLISIMVPAVEANQVKLTATGSDFRLYEVEMLGFPPVDLEEQRPLQNLALQKPAALLAAAGAFSQWEISIQSDGANPPPEPTESPALAVDGDESTRTVLSPMAGSDPSCGCNEAWMVDLQDSYLLTRAMIRFGSASEAAAFLSQGKVALSTDGSTWTDLPLSGLASLDEEDEAVLIVPLPGMAAQFVRLAADTINPLELVEVEVYGYDRELDR